MADKPASPLTGNITSGVDRLWYQSFSIWKLRGIAVAVGVAVFAAAVVGQWFAVQAGWSAFWLMIASDGMAAIVAGLFVLKLMRYSQQRRLATLQRLRIIAEMNHHIRNSLHLIELSAAVTHNREAIENISSAADRIQWTLREILARTEDVEQPLGQGQAAPDRRQAS